MHLILIDSRDNEGAVAVLIVMQWLPEFIDS